MYAKKWTGKLDDTFYGLDDLQLKVLIKFIQDHQKRVMTTNDVKAILMEFNFAGHSLVGLYNYLVWGLENELEEIRIMADIGHDLNGMHDRCFDPRTSSYETMGVQA